MGIDNKILLLGGGGHCKSCIDVIESEGKYEIAGILDDDETKIGSEILGYKILGKVTEIESFKNLAEYGFVTVGQVKTAEIRKKIFKILKDSKLKMPIIVSPHAYVSSHSKISEGTIVMHHALVNAGAKVGENTIINSKALIEHDGIVGNHTHISTGAILNGDVIVGDECFIGSNATIAEGRKILKNSFIKAGSLVK